jgi:hypothetical protein
VFRKETSSFQKVVYDFLVTLCFEEIKMSPSGTFPMVVEMRETQSQSMESGKRPLGLTVLVY